MTHTEFIARFTKVAKDCQIKSIKAIKGLDDIVLVYQNICDGYFFTSPISEIGIDDAGFYINPLDVNYGKVYEDELAFNDEEIWDMVWEKLVDGYAPFQTTSWYDLNVGDKVIWNDPNIEDYPKDERGAALRRVFTIEEIKGLNDDAIILISDGISEVETTPNELMTINPNDVAYVITGIISCEGNVTKCVRLARHSTKATQIKNDTFQLILGNLDDTIFNSNGDINKKWCEERGVDVEITNQYSKFDWYDNDIWCDVEITETLIE
jgi:hypothetical protein